jgi:hypothetical protein
MLYDQAQVNPGTDSHMSNKEHKENVAQVREHHSETL